MTGIVKHSTRAPIRRERRVLPKLAEVERERVNRVLLCNLELAKPCAEKLPPLPPEYRERVNAVLLHNLGLAPAAPKKHYTIEMMHGRCVECGDCLLWQGATNAKGHPKLCHRSARRAAWEEEKGVTLDPSQLVTVTCGQSLCMNVAHMALSNKSQTSRRANASVAVQMKRAMSSARTNRAKMGKLDMEKARYIRASDKLGIELAAELGVSKDLISKVRRHIAWREYSNPFAGLGA